ncbi:MAG: hypothetical protein M4579_004708 [Chaenotheca gracillima]|nr:MAG: hypothetical protein M4579_004708 [Chaenotheca gracillima]
MLRRLAVEAVRPYYVPLHRKKPCDLIFRPELAKHSRVLLRIKMGKRLREKENGASPHELESEGAARKRKRPDESENPSIIAQEDGGEPRISDRKARAKKEKQERKERKAKLKAESARTLEPVDAEKAVVEDIVGATEDNGGDAEASIDDSKARAKLEKQERKEQKRKEKKLTEETAEPVNNVEADPVDHEEEGGVRIAAPIVEAAAPKDKKVSKKKEKKDLKEKKKQEKKERKNKKSTIGDAAEKTNGQINGHGATPTSTEQPKKEKTSKQRRREKRLEIRLLQGKDKKHKSTPPTAVNGKADAAPEIVEEPAEQQEEVVTAVDGENKHGPDKKHRFIVFIGNLPYTTTTDSLMAHFSSVNPTSIRHITDAPNGSKSKKESERQTGKKSSNQKSTQEGNSKGFAFLEFDSYERMETCLKTFHHSVLGERRINVELTAGGGGSSTARQEKIYTKNAKLTEERRKRRENDGEKARAPASGGANGAGDADTGMGDVHPSRRARVPGT